MMKSIPWNAPTHSHRSPDLIWRLRPHSGKHIQAVPSDHLEWAVRSSHGQHQQRALRELRRRRTELITKTKPKRSHQIIQHKHRNHPMSAELCESGPHRYRLRCVRCDAHIQWLTQSDYQKIKSIK